jgi:hypothetical protein
VPHPPKVLDDERPIGAEIAVEALDVLLRGLGSMIAAGSPGARCRTAKTNTETPKSTGIASNRRRRA